MPFCMTGRKDGDDSQVTLCAVLYGYQDYEPPWCSISERIYNMDGVWWI